MTAVTYTSTEGVDLQGTEVGAWLWDTVAETVVAAELVTNGDTSAGTAGWTVVNTVNPLAVVAGEFELTADGTSTPYFHRNFTCVIGKRYVVSATVRRGTSAANVALHVSGFDFVYGTTTSNVTVYSDFVATSTTHQINAYIYGATSAGETAYFDNISCIIADEDLSATDQALRYHGTIIKAAVNTGAESMAYSNFSTLNFLSRAYDADLDITDEITMMAWVKPSSFSAEQGVAGNHNISSGDIGGYLIYILTTGVPRFITYENGGTNHVCDSAASLTLNAWSLLVASMSTSGALAIYVDGVLAGTATGGVIDSTANTFKVGVITVAEAPTLPFSGSIAGVRVINSVLTAAQIKNIYDNEKTLFKKYAPYRAVGTEYSLDIILESVTQNREIDATVVRSLGGAQETIERNRDKYYSLTMGSIARVPTAGETTARQVIETFLESVQNGETFELDIYGSVASADDPVNVIADQGYTFNMVSNNLFTTAIRVRETE